MDWTTRMNRALDYIEQNLDADIDLKQAARMAFCSGKNGCRRRVTDEQEKISPTLKYILKPTCQKTIINMSFGSLL